MFYNSHALISTIFKEKQVKIANFLNIKNN